MLKKIRVGLYEVKYRARDGRTIPDTIRAVDALPNDETRAFMLSDEPIRPRRMDVRDEYCFADFTRIRLVNEMNLADLRGKEDTIRFEPGGLHPAEKTAFVYDNRSGVLHLQDSSSISAASLGRYFKAVGNLESIRISPILKLDAMERFRRQRRFTLFKVRLAGLDDARTLADLGLTDLEMIRLAHEYGAPTATVQLQLDKRDEGTLQKIYETVVALLPLPRKYLKSMIVKGEGEEGEEEYPVDFIKDRMVYRFPLESEEEPTDDERYRAVLGAWQQHRVELRERFRATG